MINKEKLYREYIVTPHGMRSALARRYKITTSYMYDVVKKIRQGNEAKMQKCIATSRFMCIYEYKYRIRYEALPKNRHQETINELRAIIREMRKEKFPTTLIAKLLRKDTSTIIHHLND